MSRRKYHKHFLQRRAGVLLHPRSLPATGNDGVLGDAAETFIDFLGNAGFSVWQMLPIQPTGEFGSPYQCSSVHAGNPDYISFQRLCTNSWYQQSGGPPQGGDGNEDLIAKALDSFQRHATAEQKADYEQFRDRHQYWLDDYARFASIKKRHDEKPWWDWPHGLAIHDRREIRLFGVHHAALIERYRFEQYLFFTQWQDLKTQANNRGILLFGDMPIFAAHDSADVWGRRQFFKLDNKGQPTVVAGVPPDYFSPTGQRWGNPVYDWEQMVADHFRWWIERLRTQLGFFDLVRIDHFRGFDSVWEIPVSCDTAEHGEWTPVPGHRLFKVLHEHFGDLPLVAEDLGIISRSVIKLREDTKVPGMKVLQFAFDSDAKNPYLPHNHEREYLVCTGTHDNNTTSGWYDGLDETVRARVMEYLTDADEPMPWPLIRAALASVCRLAVIPLQDLLGLDASHRMNIPGTIEGNWRWRFSWDAVPADLTEKCLNINRLYDRC